MSWPRQGSQNPLDNRECKWKTWISWVWGFEVVHAVKGSFEVALPPNASLYAYQGLKDTTKGEESLEDHLPTSITQGASNLYSDEDMEDKIKLLDPRVQKLIRTRKMSLNYALDILM